MTAHFPLLNQLGSKKRLKFFLNQHYIDAEVVFGVFSNNCAGNGICSVTPKRMATNKSCNCCTAKARIYSYANQLLFCFPLPSLKAHLRKKHFSDKLFLQEETLIVPDLICNEFDLESYPIYHGFYPIEHWKENLLVLFE